MIGDRVLIQDKHKKIAKTIFNIYPPKKVKHKVIGLGGKPGSGKTEIGEELLHLYGEQGLCVVIAHIDDYYIACPSIREKHRKATGIIGVREIRFDSLNVMINDFKNKKDIIMSLYHRYNGKTDSVIIHKGKQTDVLIIEGLYGCYDKLNTDIKIHVETSLESTYQFRKERQKEDPDNDWRKQVLARETRSVNYLKQYADKVIENENHKMS